jgi:prepilin-type N-terminal cleavage/methylation domain-containing protein
MITRRQNGGFSLIEVLCAILIMGVALVALTRGMTTALASTKDSEVQTTVVALAAGQIETLRASAVLTDDTTEGDFDNFPKYKWQQTISPGEVDGLHQVEVTVEDAKSGAILYKLTTLLFDSDYPSSSASDAQQKQKELDKAKKRNRRGQ